MTRISENRKWLAAAFASAAVAQFSAQAGLSQLDISYYSTYYTTLSAQGYGHSTYATAFAADLKGGAPLPVSHTDPFVTFCLDINNNLATTGGWWKSGGFSDTPLNNDSNPADRVESGLYRAASLYAHYAPGIMSVTGNGSGFTWLDPQKGAALQLAIWEVLYEKTGTYSIDADGNNSNNAQEFYVSSVDGGVRTLANTMLSSAWNKVDLSLETTFWNSSNAQGGVGSSQDLIGPIAPVPEPTTVLAGALLLLPFMASTLRRKTAS